MNSTIHPWTKPTHSWEQAFKIKISPLMEITLKYYVLASLSYPQYLFGPIYRPTNQLHNPRTSHYLFRKKTTHEKKPSAPDQVAWTSRSSAWMRDCSQSFTDFLCVCVSFKAPFFTYLPLVQGSPNSISWSLHGVIQTSIFHIPYHSHLLSPKCKTWHGRLDEQTSKSSPTLGILALQQL